MSQHWLLTLTVGFFFVVACDALFIVRQAEVKWKIIAISVCIDYKLISAVCVPHKAALSRTDDFIHFH